MVVTEPMPPATRTYPEGSTSIVRALRAVPMLTVVDQVLVAGSYTSVLDSTVEPEEPAGIRFFSSSG